MSSAQHSGDDSWGVELGPLGTFTLRCVRPWRQDGRVIGYLELGMEVEHLSEILAKDIDAQMVSFVRKAYATQSGFEDGKEAFGFAGVWDQFPDVVISHHTFDKLPVELVQLLTGPYARIADISGFHVRHNDRLLNVGFVPQPDAMGRTVGGLLLFRDITNESALAQSMLRLNLGIEFLFFIGILALLWRITGKAQDDLKQTFSEMRERVKELTCLQKLRDILSQEPSIEELCYCAIEFLIQGMQFPDRTVPIITLYGKRFTCDAADVPTTGGIHCDIDVRGKIVGRLSVFYTDGSDFLPEEQNLIDAVAKMLGQYIDRSCTHEQLEQQYHFVQALIDAASTPIFYKDVHGVYLGCNTAFESFLGLDRSRIIGHTAVEIVDDGLAEIYDQKDRQLLAQKGTQSYESEVKTSDGIRNVIFHKAVFHDNAGEVSGLVGVITDITDRKRAELKLEESLSQVERFNRLMMGREQRIIEMKAQVNALLAELGRPEQYDSVAAGDHPVDMITRQIQEGTKHGA